MGKIFVIFLLVVLFFEIPADAQKLNTYKVNPGQAVMKTIPFNAIYQYPQFKPGIVQFKNGKAGSAMMNYNSLTMKMEFIGDKGDTLSLDDIGTMRYVAIVPDTFFYSKDFVRLLSNKNGIKLAERRVLLLSNREKLGGFGEVNGGTVTTQGQLSSSSNMLKSLVAQEILTFTETFSWYFGDKFNLFKQASRKNLLDMFGKSKPGLAQFIDDNKIDFFKDEDILKLSSFLQQ